MNSILRIVYVSCTQRTTLLANTERSTEQATENRTLQNPLCFL